MYEAYEYVKDHGINLRNSYNMYLGHKGTCNRNMVSNNWHFKNTGMEEKDNMTNEEIKRQVMQQPIGAAIYSVPKL